ncbi:hypothetical protein IEQ34_019102 [Dendrobium chrysotoxum]|uniref:Uncharacterized protein n=1 Tax=Dendrobium chrysotoxum TaxID=161865 RepID=A0AAV7G914_DENCH|nr:hypothetical protein IEQ34_019102 [Dendrobium chrysotoxum]
MRDSRSAMTNLARLRLEPADGSSVFGKMSSPMNFASARIDILFGRPIETDNATAMGSQPSVARILIKLDVTKTLRGIKKSACLILHPHLRKFVVPKSVLATTDNNPIIVGDFDNVPLNDHNVVLDNVHLDNELLASPVKPLIDGVCVNNNVYSPLVTPSISNSLKSLKSYGNKLDKTDPIFDHSAGFYAPAPLFGPSGAFGLLVVGSEIWPRPPPAFAFFERSFNGIKFRGNLGGISLRFVSTPLVEIFSQRGHHRGCAMSFESKFFVV